MTNQNNFNLTREQDVCKLLEEDLPWKWHFVSKNLNIDLDFVKRYKDIVWSWVNYL